MKNLRNYILESEKIKIDFSNIDNELKIRKEVNKEIDNGDLTDGAEMAEHYQNILNAVFNTKDIGQYKDDDLRILMAIIDNEYENHGFKSDLSDEDNHKKEIKRQLEKLHKLQK